MQTPRRQARSDDVIDEVQRPPVVRKGSTQAKSGQAKSARYGRRDGLIAHHTLPWVQNGGRFTVFKHRCD
jgi:hypothetical protein